MSIAILEQVRVAAGHSVRVSSPLLEPGTNAEVIDLAPPSSLRENPIHRSTSCAQIRSTRRKTFPPATKTAGVCSRHCALKL